MSMMGYMFSIFIIYLLDALGADSLKEVLRVGPVAFISFRSLAAIGPSGGNEYSLVFFYFDIKTNLCFIPGLSD